MDSVHCHGCHDDVYNHGLGGATGCWMLEDAQLIWKKAVHINQRPPWNQQAQLLPKCYRRPCYVYVKPDQTR